MMTLKQKNNTEISETSKFCCIGAGAMGAAIIKGLVSNKTFNASEILVLDLDQEKLASLKKELGINTAQDYNELKEQINPDTFIMLAVKPQVFDKVLESLSGIKNPLISIAAGIKIEAITKVFADNSVFRVMPNTPAQILKAASALSYNSKASIEEIEMVKKIFSAIGVCVEVEEKDLDAVTALSGSGPAYVFLMCEAMTQAGIKLGLSEDTATKLARQTLYGASNLMVETQEEAKALREKVTSPNGTTQAGLENLIKNDFNEVIATGIEAAFKRSQELSQ